MTTRASAALLAAFVLAGCNAKDRDDPDDYSGTNTAEVGEGGPVPATLPGIMDTVGTLESSGQAPIPGDNMGVDTAGSLPSGAPTGPGAAGASPATGTSPAPGAVPPDGVNPAPAGLGQQTSQRARPDTSRP